MGVTYSLHLIDPAKFSRIVGELQPRTLLSARDVELYLDRYHVTDPETRHGTIDAFKDAFKDPTRGALTIAYSQLLLRTAAEAQWYIDKSLNHNGLTKPIKTFPALRPVRFLVSFEGWYTQPPAELRCDSGLYGLWSTQFLKPALDAVERFSNRESAQAYSRAVNWSLADRMLRRNRGADGALAVWIDYWESWEEICSAIKMTTDRQWSLGFAMYP